MTKLATVVLSFLVILVAAALLGVIFGAVIGSILDALDDHDVSGLIEEGNHA